MMMMILLYIHILSVYQVSVLVSRYLTFIATYHFILKAIDTQKYTASSDRARILSYRIIQKCGHLTIFLHKSWYLNGTLFKINKYELNTYDILGSLGC